MTVRPPVMAGRFYPADPAQCRQLVKDYLRRAVVPAEAKRPWIGGLVPHAGWVCSAAIAAQTLAAMVRQSDVDTIVVFGAVHTPLPLQGAALDTHSAWGVPTGSSLVKEELNRKLLESPQHFRSDPRFHQHEHAVEVELPLIQDAFAGASILPVEVAPDASASTVGRQTAQAMQKLNLKPIFLASSDLTHYGPDYGFTPAGVGPAALDWAMDNDRRLLDLILHLSDEQIVPEVQNRFNACGAGAIAAMLAASKVFGASQGRLISHANSFQTLRNVAPQPPNNAVGYASLVVG